LPDALATVNDLEARWRTLTDPEKTRAAVLLIDATTWLRALRPEIDGRLASGDLNPNAVVQLIVGAVKRSMEAPAGGIRQQSQSMGPYTQFLSFANPAGSISFTEADLVLIDGYRPSALSMRFSN
jgi:hypothetical protein